MRAESVHYVMIPDCDMEVINPEITVAVRRMQSVIELGRTCRDRRKIGLKTPVSKLTDMNTSESFVEDIRLLQEHIQDELNARDVAYRSDTGNVTLSAVLNFKVLGKTLGKDMKKVQEAAKALSQDQLAEFEQSGQITLCGHSLTADTMGLARRVKDLNDPNLEAYGNAETMVIVDFTPDEGLRQLALAREIANKIQRLRKHAKLQQDAPVQIWAEVLHGSEGSGSIGRLLEERATEISKLIRKPLQIGKAEVGDEALIEREEMELDGPRGDRLVVSIFAEAQP